MSALDALAGFTFLNLLLGGGGGPGAFSADVPAGPLPPLPNVPPRGPIGPVVVPPAAKPGLIIRPRIVTPAIAPRWPVAMPEGLPPFPGDGWEPDTPVSAPVVQRAVALLPQLWAEGQGAHTTEMTAGHWVTYLAQILNGKHGVTAWRLKPAHAAIPAAHAPETVLPAMQVTYRPDVKPAPLGAYPGPGAWQSNASWIRKYQAALQWLSIHAGNHDWDPQGVDGKFGPLTRSAVLAFQRFNGIRPVDGEVGPATGGAIDRYLAATGVAA